MGGSRQGSGRRRTCWGFFFPTTAFYSVQRSISSLLFFSTVQHTIFSTPPIVLTAFFCGLSSSCAFSLKYHAPNRRLTQQQPYQCCAECITSHASQALCQLMNPKTIFGVVWFFFLATVNLYSACNLQKNAGLSLKSCHLTKLVIVPCCISFKQVMVKGCTLRRMQTSWTRGKWLLDHETESLWKGDCYSHFCCWVAALRVPVKWFCQHNALSFLWEAYLSISALRD